MGEVLVMVHSSTVPGPHAGRSAWVELRAVEPERHPTAFHAHGEGECASSVEHLVARGSIPSAVGRTPQVEPAAGPAPGVASPVTRTVARMVSAEATEAPAPIVIAMPPRSAEGSQGEVTGIQRLQAKVGAVAGGEDDGPALVGLARA